MAVINIIKRSPSIIKKGVDKVFKRTISGAEGSPFKLVDDLGSFPNYRNIKDTPGTEKKKLKMIGEKLRKNKKDSKVLDQSNKVRGGLKFGGSTCKLATKGKGRAYGKNS